MPAMHIVPLYQVHEQYDSAFRKRQVQLPWLRAGTVGFAVVTDRGDFAAGVVIYPAEGLVVAEHLVTNPDIPMWERHQGVVEMAKAFRVYATVANKVPMIMVRHRGLARALMRAGFKSNGAMCFSAP